LLHLYHLTAFKDNLPAFLLSDQADGERP